MGDNASRRMSGLYRAAEFSYWRSLDTPDGNNELGSGLNYFTTEPELLLEKACGTRRAAGIWQRRRLLRSPLAGVTARQARNASGPCACSRGNDHPIGAIRPIHVRPAPARQQSDSEFPDQRRSVPSGRAAIGPLPCPTGASCHWSVTSPRQPPCVAVCGHVSRNRSRSAALDYRLAPSARLWRGLVGWPEDSPRGLPVDLNSMRGTSRVDPARIHPEGEFSRRCRPARTAADRQGHPAKYAIYHLVRCELRCSGRN